MSVQFSTTLRNARLDQIGTTLGSGGFLRVYSGTAPGVSNALTTQTLLAELTAVTYAAASGGTKTFTATADASADASGTPTFARLYKSDGTTCHAEFDAAVGSGTLNFNSAISAGGTVSLTSGQFTEGNP